MIAQLLKKSLPLAVLMFVSINANDGDENRHHHHHDRHHSHVFQVLINPSDPSFQFNLFNGQNIITNIFAPRPAGSYYYINGLIFPKHTINPDDQTCFNFDRHGNPLDESNSVGTFRCIAHQLTDLTFDENYPSKGTIVEDVRWDFYFKEDCGIAENHIVAFGQVATGLFEPNTVGFQANGMTVTATICNGTYNFMKRAKAFFNNFENCTFGPQILIEIDLENKIVYRED